MRRRQGVLRMAVLGTCFAWAGACGGGPSPGATGGSGTTGSRGLGEGGAGAGAGGASGAGGSAGYASAAGGTAGSAGRGSEVGGGTAGGSGSTAGAGGAADSSGGQPGTGGGAMAGANGAAGTGGGGGSAGGFDGGASGGYVEICQQVCDRFVACAGYPGQDLSCKANCVGRGPSDAGLVVTPPGCSYDVAAQMYAACLAKATCEDFITCEGNVADCGHG
jgi:hypothetical protein